MSSSGVEPNFFGYKQDTKTSDVAEPPPYTIVNQPSAPSIDTFPPYGTVKNSPPALEPATNDDRSKKYIWIILGFFASLLFLSKCTSSFPFGWRLYDWEELPKEFEFQPSTRLLFQTVGGSLSEGHIHIKEGSGRVELSAKISSDLVDNPELTYSLTHDDGSTVFEIHIPPHYNYRHRRYVRLDATFYVPRMDVLDIKLQNSEYGLDENASFDIKSLLLSTTNTNIKFGTDWKGKELALKTTNGKILVTRSLLGADTVTLQTSNGGIRSTETIQTEKFTRLVTSNGGIDSEKVLETPDLKLKASNAPVHVYQVNANTAIIATSNARLELKHANVTSSLNTKTSNADLYVNVDACQYCSVAAQTSNSEITANLPVDHEGPFSIQTSSSRSVHFEDRLNWSKLQVVKKSSVQGERYNPDESASKGGKVVVQTTNADAHVSFK